MFVVGFFEAETNQAGEGLWRTDDEAQAHVARIKAAYPRAEITVMADQTARKQIGTVYWLKHCGSWFGFPEPVKAVCDRSGAFFASVKTGERVQSIAQNGFKEPPDQYHVTAWRRGTLEFRTETTDDIARALYIARLLYAALGITYTVMIEDSKGQSFCSYEWDQLASRAAT